MSVSAISTSPSDPAPPRSRPSLGLRLWRIVASPWCTLALLALLALAGILSILLPQAGSTAIPIYSYWLATLQGRYGRWTGLLSNLGLFDIADALWFHALLVLVAYQSLVAMVEGSDKAWHWLHEGTELRPHLPSIRAWKGGEISLPSASLEQGVAEVQSAFQRLGYRAVVSRDEGKALLEAMRHPWLALGRPLAYGGVVLACVAGLLSGRLDWQEGPIILSTGQQYELHHVRGGLLRLDQVGLGHPSSQLYSWVSLLRDGQPMCAGAVSTGRALNCGGVHIQQSHVEPALHIAGYDAAAHPLIIESVRGMELTDSGVTLSMPFYLSDRYAVLAQRGLVLHVEASSGQDGPFFRLEVYRGQQSAPLLQRDIVGPTSLSLDDLTFGFVPTRVPSFRISHSPTQPLRWVALSLVLVGLLAGVGLSAFHWWVEMEERASGIRLRFWRGHPLLLPGSAIRAIWARLTSVSEIEP